jgi:hypothetical protein
MSAVLQQRAQMRTSRRRTSSFQHFRPDIDDRTGFRVFPFSARLIELVPVGWTVWQPG